MRIGFEQLNQPSIYYNIIDIINSTEPPKLISPRDNYHGSDENSLKQDEVLLVKGVHLSRVRRIKSLIVMSIKTSKEKKLPSDCPVTFSTESTCNQVRTYIQCRYGVVRGTCGYICLSCNKHTHPLLPPFLSSLTPSPSPLPSSLPSIFVR